MLAERNSGASRSASTSAGLTLRALAFGGLALTALLGTYCRLPGPTGHRGPAAPGAKTTAAPGPLLIGFVAPNGEARLWWKSAQGARAYVVLRQNGPDGVFQPVTTLSSRRVSFRERLPACAQDVCGYAVQVELGQERRSRTQTVRLEAPRKSATKERFILNSMRGSRWTTTHWDGENAPQEVQLDIQYGIVGIKAVLRVGTEEPETFPNAMEKEPRVLEAPRFRMEFFAADERMAGLDVTLRDGSERSFLLLRSD